MTQENDKNLREIAQELLKEIAKEAKDSGEEKSVPSDGLLSANLLATGVMQETLKHLYFNRLRVVFPQTLPHALSLVDQNCITKVSSPSGRELFQVEGSSGRIYNCLMSSEYCTCPSYTYYVLMKDEILMCKHILAVYIAQNLGTFDQREVSDENFFDILTDVES
ncbi:zinc finger SWIM domain-containing protein 7-like [Dendronephthya gigantea]|uniref:zinc finger SWIM domain-containing protein 7-like n=1 Tax=Dendronephthya gigantea TaxID=151771 RepID=UPI00106B2760|nr:zinc finger SWIM domain-containing protein 7-like [Dendronephthya gigantea]